MIYDSKIIEFIVDFGDSLESAYKNSLFFKWIKRTLAIWKYSNFGKVIIGFFSAEVYEHSVLFKTLKNIFDKLVEIIIVYFPLKAAKENSRYITILKKQFKKINKIKLPRIKNIIANSLCINAIYNFWLNLE